MIARRSYRAPDLGFSEILEAGTRAFVCHIESYVKHDCNIVCGLKGNSYWTNLFKAIFVLSV